MRTRSAQIQRTPTVRLYKDHCVRVDPLRTAWRERRLALADRSIALFRLFDRTWSASLFVLAVVPAVLNVGHRACSLASDGALNHGPLSTGAEPP